MRKNILLSLFAVMLAVGLLMASMLYQRYSDSERLSYLTTLPPYTGHLSHTLPVQTTKPALSDAPDVQFYDADGKQVQLSDFEGKPVVINFWASWVNPSREELPVFQSAYEAYRDRITFLMINVTDGERETERSAREYWEALDTQLPVYFDLDSGATAGFRVTTVPSTFFIDAEGKSVAYAPGELTAEQLEYGIRMCMDSE